MLRALWEKYKAWKARRAQRTFCYCPDCGNELCGDVLTACYDGGSFVTDDCGQCHTESTWDFDTPVPALVAWQVKP